MRNRLIGLLAIAFMIQACGETSCDCNEVQLDKDRGLWMTVETSEIYTGKCTSHFDDGTVSVKGEFRQGKPFGTWEEFYDNGNPKSKTEFTNGVKTRVERWFKNGNKESSSVFEDEVLIEYYEWYEDGKDKMKNVFTSEYPLAKSLDGWFPNGQVAFHLESQEGTPLKYYPEADYKKDINRYKTSFDKMWRWARYNDDAKGKVFKEDGRLMTESFFENEIKIRYKGKVKSLRTIVWDRSSGYKFIGNLVPYYDKYDDISGGFVVTGGNTTTIQEACSWYSEDWGSPCEIVSGNVETPVQSDAVQDNQKFGDITSDCECVQEMLTHYKAFANFLKGTTFEEIDADNDLKTELNELQSNFTDVSKFCGDSTRFSEVGMKGCPDFEMLKTTANELQALVNDH